MYYVILIFYYASASPTLLLHGVNDANDGGTESDNWVLESAAESATESDSAHIIVSAISPADKTRKNIEIYTNISRLLSAVLISIL